MEHLICTTWNIEIPQHGILK